MIYSYDELLEMKKKGTKLNWDDISEEQLSYLFINENILNNMIADLYDVNPSKVRYKRKKWGISIYSPEYMYHNFMKDNENIFSILNDGSKGRLMGKENINWISKALTHYCFRNGPVEDMHVNNQLSQEDMKVLNKFMINKIANLLTLANDGEWLKIEILLASFSNFGTDWDSAEIDMEDVDMIFNHELEKIKDSFKVKSS